MIDLGNTFILGDSYSTFEGYNPEGYAVWYNKEIVTDTDVCSVGQTWWKQLLENTKSQLVLNCSWSGTTICHTGYSGDCSEISFIARFDKLEESGFFKENSIDTFFVFGGTNDSWAGSPLGEKMESNWQKEDLFSVLPAINYLAYRLNTVLPETKTVFIINTELKPEISAELKAVCEKYGFSSVELQDIEKQSGHPNKNGMFQIFRQVMDCLENG